MIRDVDEKGFKEGVFTTGLMIILRRIEVDFVKMFI